MKGGTSKSTLLKSPANRELRRIDLLVLGSGGVAQSLIEQILTLREVHRERFGLQIDLSLLSDSRSFLMEDQGPLEESALREALALKEEGGSLSEIPGSVPIDQLSSAMTSRFGEGWITVDCTATSQTSGVLERSLRLGGKIVLANKKPLTGPMETYRLLTNDWTRARWETTVGSCLPIVSTLHRIAASGDEVLRVTGVFSGTLGFLMTRLEEGVPFSKIVRQAYEAGFTEPDPREDTAGIDLARKVLILARGIGWDVDLEDVGIQGLTPQKLQELPTDGFLKEIGSLDEYYRVRVRSNQKRGKVLRYVAHLEQGSCRVGPEEVEKDSPLGRLKGHDNRVEFYTRLYDLLPLVIQGRGAGVPATSSGVLSDIVELAQTVDRHS